MFQVLMSVYKYYFAAIGYLVCLVVIFCYVSATGLGIGGNLWLADWSSSSTTTSSFKLTNLTEYNHTTITVNTRLGVYFFLGIGQGKHDFNLHYIGKNII